MSDELKANIAAENRGDVEGDAQSNGDDHGHKLATLFAIVLVDLLGFSIVLPLIPYYAEAFGASGTLTGLLIASYAIAQIFGAPLLGNLSDRYGRRPVLLVSIFGTALGFVIFGLANTLLLLFVSRTLDGLTGGNISVAQAYIADISTPKNRARNFGLIGAAFGLGFIVGPALGGLLYQVGQGWNSDGGLVTNWGFALPAFVGAAIALINMVAVYFFLPESRTVEERAESAKNGSRGLNIGKMLESFQRPGVGPLLGARFFYALAFALFQTIFSLFVLARLGYAADTTAYILSYVGILVALVQGLLVGRLADRFPENRLLLWSTLMMGLALFAWAFTPNLIYLLLVLIPISLAGGVFNSVINSLLSDSVAPQEVGGILGISASLESMTRALAPILGGVLLDYIGTWSPGVFGAIILVLLTPYVWRKLIVKAEQL